MMPQCPVAASCRNASGAGSACSSPCGHVGSRRCSAASASTAALTAGLIHGRRPRCDAPGATQWKRWAPGISTSRRTRCTRARVSPISRCSSSRAPVRGLPGTQVSRATRSPESVSTVIEPDSAGTGAPALIPASPRSRATWSPCANGSARCGATDLATQRRSPWSTIQVCDPMPPSCRATRVPSASPQARQSSSRMVASLIMGRACHPGGAWPTGFPPPVGGIDASSTARGSGGAEAH
jgi:hypothetical protein